MDNREVNYSDILPQEQPPKHLSMSCNARVKLDVNVKNIFEMVNHSVINIVMVLESTIRKRHYWQIFILP